MTKKQLVISFISCLVCLTGRAQIPASLTGNYINRETNNWEYGFFERFAIYDCDFWEYASVKQQGAKTKIVLQKDSRTLSLEVKQKKDGSLTVTNGQNRREYVRMTGVSYPKYQTKDTASFPRPQFRRDSATITGYLHNFNTVPEQFKAEYGKNFFEVHLSDFASDDEINLRSAIDSSGRFSITVPVVNTQEITLDRWRLGRNIVLSPNDRIFVFAEMNDFLPHGTDANVLVTRARDKQIIFMGDNARLNNELAMLKDAGLHINYQEDPDDCATDMDFLRKCEDFHTRRMQHLNGFIEDYPAVSAKFVLFNNISEKYRFASDLMNLQSYYYFKGKAFRRYQEGYMDYVNQNFSPYGDSREAYMLAPDYRSFLRNYIAYPKERSRRTSVTLNQIFEALEKENAVTPEIRQYVEDVNAYVKIADSLAREPSPVAPKEQLLHTDRNRYEDLDLRLDMEPDSVKRANLKQSVNALIAKINSDRLISETAASLIESAFFGYELAYADSMIQDPFIKEYRIAVLYHERFEDEHKPLHPRDRTVFDERIATPLLREHLLSANDYYNELNAMSMEGEESLKNTGHLTGIYDADAILEQLIEPYRGKVIYLDFWGTWCAPCREFMKLVAPVKEHFEDRDVIFMYLASNSPERTWKNMIKEMNLTGKQIVHYRLPDFQQSLLETRFSINEFPTYMIIDREGKIIDPKAPWPLHDKRLISALEKALEKVLE
jgi:thiol-disulfide isomerase/thioredoxin